MDPHEASRLDNAERNGSLTAESVVLSWRFEPVPVIGLTFAALAYVRGWRRLHGQLPLAVSGGAVGFLSGRAGRGVFRAGFTTRCLCGGGCSPSTWRSTFC